MDLASAKVIGAGLAAIGVGAAAAGVGYVFGSFLQSALRNPAAADGQQGRLFIGFAAAELLGLMRGSAAVSAGGSEQLERLKAAFEQDAEALSFLQSDDEPGRVLAALRARPGEAGAAVAGYLDLIGNRLLDGFDISEPTAIEMPDALIRAIRIAT